MIRNLQSLRFMFTLLVFLSHFIGRRFDFGGECGVSFFFILSGFVLSESQGAKLAAGAFRHGAFLGRQVAKFLPLHWLLVAAFLLLDFRAGHWPGWERAAASALLLQSWIPMDSWHFVANGVSWFLSDILFFYLLFPFLYNAVARARRTTLAVAVAVIVVAYLLVAMRVPSSWVNGLLYCWPPLRLPDFVAGIILHKVYRSDAGIRMREHLAALRPWAATACEGLAVAWMVSCYIGYEAAAPWFRCAALFWIMLPPVVLFFASAECARGCVTRLLHSRLVLWLGGLSFEIYMVHCLVKRVVYDTLHHFSIAAVPTISTGDTALIIVLSFCLTVAAAYLLQRFLVAPARRLKII